MKAPAPPTLRAVVARLRAECPWDAAQTHRSLRPYLVEEAFEVLDALDALPEVGPAEPGPAEGAGPRAGGEAPGAARDADRQLREELGDLLLQIHLHAEIAAGRGAFTLDDVEEGIRRKMVERHPHVFPDTPAAAPGSLPSPAGAGPSRDAGWEAAKARKNPDRSRVDGVPSQLPALLRAHRVGEKLAHVGFDWPDVGGVLAKVDEERQELAEALAEGDRAHVEAEYGDLLLACANLGRFLGISGEDALRAANRRFEGRFRRVEALARAAGVALEEAGMERLEAWWQEAKRCEDSGDPPRTLG